VSKYGFTQQQAIFLHFLCMKRGVIPASCNWGTCCSLKSYASSLPGRLLLHIKERSWNPLNLVVVVCAQVSRQGTSCCCGTVLL